MLEESRMDKKLNRSTQPQSRASAVDCKKNSDLTHKPWPRNNKKREGPGGTPKNEPFRKNVSVPRGRGSGDRRSRPRESASSQMDGTPNSRLGDDDEPEIGSVFVPGSKKQNFNHLLNFMYPTRGNIERSERRGPLLQRRQFHRLSFRQDHDLYLRAYCQFVVKEDYDYKINSLDPDVPIKWDEIEEIVVRSTGKSECPICLGTPVAGRVGLCSHVYCWACVLHYAAAHEKQPPPCPVCTAPLNVKDMKPTKMLQWDAPAEEVTMRLVRRLRGSTIVEVAPLRGQVTDSIPSSILPIENIHSAPFCKMFSANKHQIHEILKRERNEIETQILEEIDTTEIVYLEQALQMLKQKEDKIGQKNEMLKIDVENNEVPPPIVYEKQEVNENKLDWFNVTDDGAACMEDIQNEIANIDLKETKWNPDAPEFSLNEGTTIQASTQDGINDVFLSETDNTDTNKYITDIDKQNQAKYFYFYQAEDGQQVFLNSLNVRILNESWGALAAAPTTITGRVLHRETLPLTEQTRKHMPYTAHLPLYCSVDIVELELQPPYVTANALENFTEELYRRARVRARHERDERRRERAYRRQIEGPPKPDFSSDELFPPASSSFSSAGVDPPLAEEPSPSTSMSSPPPSGLSFAKMAGSSGTWRVRPTVSAPPPPPPPDEEGTGPRALNLSDAIEAALHAAPVPSTKKNKKSKQKVLFATGMQRAA